MKISCLILALFAVKAYTLEYDFKVFMREIDAKCLGRLSMNQVHDDFQLIGQTMESFISLVQKVERNHPHWNIYQVSRALLKRFAFEGMIFAEPGGLRDAEQKGDYKTRWDIIKELVRTHEDISFQDDSLFNEDDLTDQEKCSMFFMMGHLVNNTFRDGIDEEQARSDIPLDLDPIPSGVLRTDGTSRRAKKPREQGIVTVRGDLSEVVSVSKILNALLASTNNNEPNIRDLYNINTIKDFPADRQVNPLIGVTVGDVLSVALQDHKGGTSGSRYFGPDGEWNNNVCPTEFKLYEATKGTTKALLRGAVDGLLISKAIEMSTFKDTQDLRLSRVLRMYYSRQGIPLQNSAASGNQGISYCQRQDGLSIAGEISQSIESFYYVYMAKRSNKLADQTVEKIGAAISNMRTALSEMDGHLRSTDACARPREDSVCETPSNVFFVLDTSERHSEGFVEQEAIIGRLASKFDFGVGAGSLSVFYDSKFDRGLRPVYYNATNPTCATCATSRLDSGHEEFGKLTNEVQLLDGLNKTLQNFELVTDLEPGVPNKVVVLFHYHDLVETNTRTLKGAANILRDGHRDTRVFAVGNNFDTLSLLATSNEHVIAGNPGIEGVVNQLAERICKVPAVFQFNRCWDHKKNSRNEHLNVYSGYVSHNHVQYWAFYPEYFLKSYDIKIKFSAKNGDIEVCESRDNANPGSTDNKLERNLCKATDRDNRELVFTYKNPCHKYHLHNCAPLHFAITGNADNHLKPVCPASDEKCRRLDQILFEVSHEGIACSGCAFLKISPVILLLACIHYFLK